jgi:hypothetical protein
MKVTLIGIPLGIDIAPYLQQYFPNLYVDAAVSRQFSEAKGIVQQLIESDSLGQAVIIELGSNGIISESHLRALIELIGSEINVVFINIQVPRSWCEGNNATLSKVCAEYANVAVADWYSVSDGQDEFFYSDDVHPNSIGSPILVKSSIILSTEADGDIFAPLQLSPAVPVLHFQPSSRPIEHISRPVANFVFFRREMSAIMALKHIDEISNEKPRHVP